MINIFFRTTSNKKQSNRPDWFSYEKCWNNILATRDGNPITVIHDGPIYDSWWYKKFEDVELIEIDSEPKLKELIQIWEDKKETYVDRDENGNVFEKRTEKPDREKAAGYLMYEIIFNKVKPGTEDLIYMVEDDYLHVNGWTRVLEDVFKLYKNLSYATLYDHPDKYTQRYAGLSTQIILSNYCHWRLIPSSCGTFGGKVSTFLEDKDIHQNNLGDHNKFIKLTEKKRSIVSPLPGLATHCVNPWLSRYNNWSVV
jgi:hypothetical protein